MQIVFINVTPKELSVPDQMTEACISTKVHRSKKHMDDFMFVINFRS